MKKLTLTLVLVLLTSLFLFGNGNKDQDSVKKADVEMTPYGAYSEPITITIPKIVPSNARFPEGKSVSDNAMIDFLSERLNINVEIAWEVNIVEDYKNKLALNLTAGDLPNAFTLNATTDYLFYRQLVESDALADLSQGLESCEGDYMKSTFGSFDYRNLSPFREDNELLGIAGGFYGYEHNLLWVRQDWLEELGLPEPKTMEDIANVALAFKENNMGGQGNVGLVLNYNNPVSKESYSANPVFGAFHAFPGMWYKNDNGEVLWGNVAPEIKEGLAVLAEWYDSGVIDKQFPTRSASNEINALVSNEQCGIFFAPWWVPYTLFPDLPNRNPDAFLKAYNLPLDEKGNFNTWWPGPSNTSIHVEKDYQYPEAVVKMLNVIFDSWRELDPELAASVKPYKDAGTDWVTLFPTGGVNLEYSDAIPATGYFVKNYLDNGVFGFPDGRNYTGFDTTLAKECKEYVDTGTLDNPGWITYYGRYFASNTAAEKNVKITYPYYSFDTPSMMQYKANLDKLEKQTMLQIITGEKPVDYFDEFVEMWYTQGGEIITKEVIEIGK